MTKILLPKMLEKKGGVIVNISSAISQIIAPMMTVYSASKVMLMK